MRLIGLNALERLTKDESAQVKLVFNSRGAIFFPVDQQHRDQEAPGISYEDGLAGNALAAILSPGRIEIRRHADFSDEAVAYLLRALLAQSEVAALRGWTATYGGSQITAAGT